MSNRDKAREERLAAALRENLRKRKAQARGIGTGTPAKTAGDRGEADQR